MHQQTLNCFQLNNYSKINNDITDLMRTGLYSGAMINIYTDSAGTVFARDGNAPIEHKKISKINTTGAYTIWHLMIQPIPTIVC